MRYIIIGLGIYGTNLARDLSAMGHQVIGADINEANVQAVKDFVATTYVLDSTEADSLGVLPLNGVDVVIVAIGENFGASVKTVALLKKMGVKHIYARAIDELHQAILKCFDLERIITPEQTAARHLSREMELGTQVATLHVTENDFVARFQAPTQLLGTAYADLNLEQYGMKLITVTRPTRRLNLIGVKTYDPVVLDLTAPDLKVEDGDVLIVLSTKKALVEFHDKLMV